MESVEQSTVGDLGTDADNLHQMGARLLQRHLRNGIQLHLPTADTPGSIQQVFGAKAQRSGSSPLKVAVANR